VPPLRFWQYDAWTTANSGCYDQTLIDRDDWICNGYGDFGIGTENGHWFLFQSNWQAPCVAGCPNAGVRPLRTVAEMSFVNPSAEGTVNHDSWYVIAAVDADYDFDRVRGGALPGAASCNGREVPALHVPAFRIEERENAGFSACTGSPDIVNPTPSGGNFTVHLLLDEVRPAYFTEVGHNDPATPLIEGYELLYHAGATLADEPTSSDPCQGWSRVPGSGIVRFGGCDRVAVTLPDTGALYWLAVRIVYVDCSVNASKDWSPGCTTTRPLTPATILGSKVSRHCGPVQ
jgi:hypothetical protein